MLTSRITHDGQSFDLEISACNLQMDGEFAGNLDLAVDTKPSLSYDALIAKLQVSAGGSPQALNPTGYANTASGFDLTLTYGIENPPESLTFFWAGESIGSETLKQVHVADYDESERFAPKSRQGCGTAAMLLLGLGLSAATAMLMRG